MENGLEKTHLFYSHDEAGIPLVTSIKKPRSGEMIKLASVMDKEIMDYIEALNPEKGRRYILINALGAEEFYGSNVNGDAYPISALSHSGPDYGYKTFEMYSYFYKHHQNKDPKNKYGDVHLSVYNARMHRIELVCSIIIDKAPDLVDMIDNGKNFFTSIGSRNPFDVCSICGHKSKTRAEYCEHLKNSMNKILEDGRKVYARNPFPRFHDISYVEVPAELTSRALVKIASILESEKLSETNKNSEIEKIVPDSRVLSGNSGEIVSSLVKNIKDKTNGDKDLDPNLIKVLSKYPIDKVLSTLLAMGIIPKPHEFVKMSGLKTDFCFNPRIVDDVCPVNIDVTNPDPDIMKLASISISDRSFYNQYILDRLSSNNDNSKEIKYSDSPELNKLAFIYGTFRKEAAVKFVEGFDPLVRSNSALIALLIGAGIIGSRSGKRMIKGEDVKPIKYKTSIPAATILPIPASTAFFMQNAYLPMEKTSANETLKLMKSFGITIDCLSEKIEIGKSYIKGLEKIAKVNSESVDFNYEESSIFYLLKKN